jgi:hypothetical protein
MTHSLPVMREHVTLTYVAGFSVVALKFALNLAGWRVISVFDFLKLF